MPDHRATYSVLKLLVNGSRMVDDYGSEDAIADYVELHPGADPVKVRAELNAELSRLDELQRTVDMRSRDRKGYTVGQLLATGSRFYLDDYSEEDAIQDYLELHPDASESQVRQALKAELADPNRITCILIDPQTSPYSSREEILAEIAEIEKLPATSEREDVLDMMRRWLEMKKRTKGRSGPSFGS